MKTIAEVINHVRKENPTLSHWALTSICMQIWGKIYGNAKIDQVHTNVKVVHVEQDGDPINEPTDQLYVGDILKCDVPTYIIPDYLGILKLKDIL